MCQHKGLPAMMGVSAIMYANMAAPAGHGLAHPSRRKVSTRPSGRTRTYEHFANGAQRFPQGSPSLLSSAASAVERGREL
jgi:hypothetical protein